VALFAISSSRNCKLHISSSSSSNTSDGYPSKWEQTMAHHSQDTNSPILQGNWDSSTPRSHHTHHGQMARLNNLCETLVKVFESPMWRTGTGEQLYWRFSKLTEPRHTQPPANHQHTFSSMDGNTIRN